jgi:hypothetical protein
MVDVIQLIYFVFLLCHYVMMNRLSPWSMGPICNLDGITLPVHVSSSIYRPFRMSLRKSSIGNNDDTFSLKESCQGTNHKCSCQRLLNHWPSEPYGHVTPHKSMCSSSSMTNVRSGHIDILHLITDSVTTRSRRTQQRQRQQYQHQFLSKIPNQ